MGTRIVHEIVTNADDDATTVCILYSNCSHAEQDAMTIFEASAKDSIGPTHLLERLMDARYETTSGNHRANDRVFALVDSPYGDYEAVQRASFTFDGCVVDILPANEREAKNLPTTPTPGM
jgi:hypothetical protein